MLHGSEVGGLEVLGGVDWLASRPGVAVVVAIGDTRLRHQAVTSLRRAGHKLATVVHPQAVIGPRVSIGEGAIVCPEVVVTTDVEVGDAVILNFGCVVGHDTRIGETATIGPNAAIGGNVRVGQGADIGIGASIIQGCAVGEWTIVGAGAVVVRSLPGYVTAVGVPASSREAPSASLTSPARSPRSSRSHRCLSRPPPLSA